jgi:hypothetical protein
MGGGGEAGEELSTDNVKGIVLALLSSGFIIKKKGLRRSAVASGVGVGPRSSTSLSYLPSSVVAQTAPFGMENDVSAFACFLTMMTCPRVQGSAVTRTSWSPCGGLE